MRTNRRGVARDGEFSWESGGEVIGLMFLGCQVCRGNLKGEISVANVAHCREIRKSPLLFWGIFLQKKTSL